MVLIWFICTVGTNFELELDRVLFVSGVNLNQKRIQAVHSILIRQVGLPVTNSKRICGVSALAVTAFAAFAGCLNIARLASRIESRRRDNKSLGSPFVTPALLELQY
jgi:hypothetical protein